MEYIFGIGVVALVAVAVAYYLAWRDGKDAWEEEGGDGWLL